jgi:hypothetical protein
MIGVTTHFTTTMGRLSADVLADDINTGSGIMKYTCHILTVVYWLGHTFWLD